VGIKKCLAVLLFVFSFAGTHAQSCKVNNNVFKPGEQLTYKIYYHWHFVWMESGEVTFSVSSATFHTIPAYYFTGTGHSYSKYDWFFQVRDTFQTYLDTNDFTPLQFNRFTNEGSTHIRTSSIFNVLRNKAFCYSSTGGKDYRNDSVALPSCSFDPLSGIYFTRCINFSGYKQDDTIPLCLYLDNHVYHIHLKYMGKEEMTSSLGKFRCCKFKISLISGTIFKPGQEMTVWVTDDDNHMPIYVEAPIIIGSVRAELLSFSGLRNPMDAKVK